MFACKFKSFITLGCMAILAACSQVETKPEVPPEKLIEERGYVIEKEVNSIQNFRISGWNYLSSKGLILDGGVKRKYLVTFSHPCHDLRWTETLITTTTVNQLTRFDKIITRPPGGGGISNRCLIDKLYLLKAKPKEKDDQATPNQQQSESAEPMKI